jgi:RNA polymerase sigma factor (sigma-70 family)
VKHASEFALTKQEVEEAYKQYGGLVRLRCRRILNNHVDADDALQETFMRLWRYGTTYREAGSRLAWLYQVARRCCFDRLSKQQRRGEVAVTGTSPHFSARAGTLSKCF